MNSEGLELSYHDAMSWTVYVLQNGEQTTAREACVEHMRHAFDVFPTGFLVKVELANRPTVFVGLVGGRSCPEASWSAPR